jgi:outer membrane lipoprotein-sorting protein
MNPAENIERLIEKFCFIKKTSAKTSAELDKKIIDDAVAQLCNLSGRQIGFWRILMKSKITKLAVAVVIVIAAIIGLHFIGSPFKANVTFADAIKPILNARTVVFDSIVGGEGEGPVIHDIVIGNKIRRTISNMDAIMIIDVDKAKMLVLNPKSKGAMFIDIQGPVQEKHKSFIQFVRQIITDLNDMSVEQLGSQKIDGFDAIGFHSKSSNGGITVWADPQTAKPTRIEIQLGQTLYILKNIEFDVPVDESLVSMEVPAGYTLQKTEFNMKEFTEQDFIESLRIWAEYVLGGSFPENISVEDYLKTTPLVGEKISQSGVSKEDGTKLGMTFGKGMGFFQQMAPKGIDYHYQGGGVKLGDAEKAIFWYRPKGSQTYRIIYGDLTVRDISPDNIPK